MSTRRRHDEGFTLIELAIVLAVLSMLVLIGLPALLNSLARANLTNAAREASMVMRQARFEAVKRSAIVAVVADKTNKTVTAFTDANNNCTSDGTDAMISTFSITKGVDMTNPMDTKDYVGFDADASGNGCAHFLSTGAADKSGSFRFHGKDGYFETRVDPTATGKVTVRKYFGNGSTDNVADGGDWYRNGEAGKSWW